MSRGGSYGGGQSSLGYLFGSGDKEPPPQSPTKQLTVNLPPYGIDLEMPPPPSTDRKEDDNHQKPSPSNNYPRAQGQNSGNFITDRPSTRVKSVPGGDSSLGYLFGDN
ncbi:Protein SPIRAL1-like 2 [Linum perenne]